MSSNRGITKAAGFTLIELMIVLAIMGILLAVVVPSYSDSVRKSRRADAMKELMELGARQERFYAQNSTYTIEIELNSGLGIVDGETSSGGYYTLSAEACSVAQPITRCYLLKATPIGSQLKDTACGTLSLDRLGVRQATGTLGDKCW